MIANDKAFLLSDAEVWEDVVEDVVGGVFASDFAEMVKDAADVRTDKIRWGMVFQWGERDVQTLLGIT